MTTFFMFGKYSPEALKGISADRTKNSVGLIKKFGGEIVSMYTLFGENDLVLIVRFPGIEDAMKTSIALSKMSGISFSSEPAVAVEEFDKMMTGI